MRFIDRMNEIAAKAVGWLIPILILELVYDTFARYVLNAPTVWSFDVSYMLYGTIFMIGSAYTLHSDKHVRIETIYGKLSTRSRAYIDAIGYIVFFFPAVGAMIYFGTLFALRSWNILEAGGDSMWQPPIYPFKTVLPVAALLLMLQGIAEFVRCLIQIAEGSRARRQS